MNNQTRNAKNLLIVSSPPHINDPYGIPAAIKDVIFALSPAVAAAFYFYGLNALLLTAVAMFFAALADIAARRLFGKKSNIADGSALLTGLLLALSLPPTVSFWIVALGAFFAITFAKEAFGGIGGNIFNPALIGRAFIVVSWPVAATTWIKPLWWQDGSIMDFISASIIRHKLVFNAQGGRVLDAVTMATPLEALKVIDASGKESLSYLSLLIGNRGGCLGETSALALLLGGCYLIYRGHVTWHIPVSIVGTVGLLSLALGEDPLAQVFAGGLMLGAFFMATDWVTSPVTNKGKMIFGIGVGCIVMLFRTYSKYPEGVMYAILLMNAITPLIDKFIKQSIMVKKAAA